MITSLLAALALAAPASLEAPDVVALSISGELAPALAVTDDKKDKEKPDGREEIKALLKSLKGHVGKRGDEDTEAVTIIDTLMQEFPESGKKDRKAIAKAVGACLKPTRKQTKEGLFDNKLALAAATALGHMGPESVKDLAKYVEHKNFAKDLTAKRQIILALGNTKDEDAVDPLVELLTNHEPLTQAAAAEALVQFADLELKERKAVFKKVLDQITSVKNQIDNDVTDPIARERYDTIAGPMLDALRTLSGQEIRDPLEFRTWWNKNKKKDWDDGKDD